MCAVRSTVAIAAYFFVTAQGSDATLKNKTGEALYWGSMPLGWGPPPGWVPPPGWGPGPAWGPSSAAGPIPLGNPPLPLGSPPMPLANPPLTLGNAQLPLVNPPIPVGNTPLSLGNQANPTVPWWGLSDDRNVCTLDASILVVLDSSVLQPGPGPANAVRMGCADIATISSHACTDCCKMSSRYYGITGKEVYGVLINSAALGTAPDPTSGSSFKRSKRSFPPPFGPPPLSGGPGTHAELPILPPSFGVAPPRIKCMCCGPRRPFTGWMQPYGTWP